MTLILKNYWREVALTTDHAASSYGMPVAVVDGAAYGPADLCPAVENDPLPRLGLDQMDLVVYSMASVQGVSDHPLVRRFCQEL